MEEAVKKDPAIEALKARIVILNQSLTQFQAQYNAALGAISELTLMVSELEKANQPVEGEAEPKH